jgi:hypothetical protein
MAPVASLTATTTTNSSIRRCKAYVALFIDTRTCDGLFGSPLPSLIFAAVITPLANVDMKRKIKKQCHSTQQKMTQIFPINFRKSSRILYRSAAPLNEDEARFTDHYDVKSVIDLRGRGEGHYSFSHRNQIRVGSMTRGFVRVSLTTLVFICILLPGFFVSLVALFSYR